ncbi:hypothetical protein MSC49_22800 [Methylosinus sp. C49]|uniref:hypothetical protein n=1 Tax=Methylosinus sp. C49 TaxID=2699395 RepID=UPI0013672B0C|nr:hypothetical protein [Methylosinus sp. C49]BBU62345.1 hypothetical protein MSC49_22800 [Methylosinus sp. C49]
MKAEILDEEALRTVTPAALAGFARSEGWSRIEAYGAHADVYAGAGRPEIILPRTDRLGDYALVVSRLLEEFSKAMERDQLTTYRDLIVADRDVVRVRAFGGEDDGSVPVDAGVEIVAQARDMLLAAACAAHNPQPFFRAGSNKEANDYMRRVRLGQTEHGSFIVTLLAPVPPLLQPTQLPLDQGWVEIEDEPMDRMVTRRLVESLEASRAAAEQALSGESAAFDNAVTFGVSANLCEAVAGLIEQSQALEISVTWAKTRPTPEAYRKIGFSKSDSEIFREAARNFRLRQPKENQILFGTVHKLMRAHVETDGEITLKAIIDGKPQSVTAKLPEAAYSIATQAHDDKRPVIMTGDLIRVGQRWRMESPNIREFPADDSAEEDAAET